jgi:hypothetical protein
MRNQASGRVRFKPLPKHEILNMIFNAQTIMEEDPVFVSNLRSLHERIKAGKVEATSWRHLHQAIAADSLRRNGVPLKDARIVLRHGA